jgi:aerobic-type carbon monoxide dehydrogenase small subunit (CoxS/CutS family)
MEFTLNGNVVTIDADPSRQLLSVLRADLGLTGTKYGCGIGMCGTCTVLVDNVARRSCVMTLGDVSGKQVLTIEGLATSAGLHPLQQAFVDEGALQCGFCTPGMILRALALLLQSPHPTEDDVVRTMDRNLCRCGAHPRIVRAILNAANRMGSRP